MYKKQFNILVNDWQWDEYKLQGGGGLEVCLNSTLAGPE